MTCFIYSQAKKQWLRSHQNKWKPVRGEVWVTNPTFAHVYQSGMQAMTALERIPPEAQAVIVMSDGIRQWVITPFNP